MSEKDELQTLFDKSVAHIRAQGGPAVDSDGCQYLTAQGLKCAAGIFINEYEDGMENNPWSDVAHEFRGSVDPLAFRHMCFVNLLQSAHDRAALNEDGIAGDYAGHTFLNRYELRVKSLAYNNGLKYTPPVVNSQV